MGEFGDDRVKGMGEDGFGGGESEADGSRSTGD